MVASEWMRMLSHNISIHFRYLWNASQWYAYQNIWKCLWVCEFSRSWVTSFTSAASVHVRTPASNYSETHQKQSKAIEAVIAFQEGKKEEDNAFKNDSVTPQVPAKDAHNLQSKPSWPPNNNRLQCPNSDNKCNVIALFSLLGIVFWELHLTRKPNPTMHQLWYLSRSDVLPDVCCGSEYRRVWFSGSVSSEQHNASD